MTSRLSDQQIEPIDVIVETLMAYSVKLAWHELGHYSTAEMFGHDAEIYGPNFHEPYLAYTRIYGRLNTGEHMVVSSAGIGFTTLGNVILTNYLVNTDNADSLRPFLGALSLTMMFDRYNYVTNSAIWHFTGQKPFDGDDIENIISLTGINKDLGYGILLGETILETILRWEEIQRQGIHQ